jgi:hypothetical protein
MSKTSQKNLQRKAKKEVVRVWVCVEGGWRGGGGGGAKSDAARAGARPFQHARTRALAAEPPPAQNAAALLPGLAAEL